MRGGDGLGGFSHSLVHLKGGLVGLPFAADLVALELFLRLRDAELIGGQLGAAPVARNPLTGFGSVVGMNVFGRQTTVQTPAAVILKNGVVDRRLHASRFGCSGQMLVVVHHLIANGRALFIFAALGEPGFVERLQSHTKHPHADARQVHRFNADRHGIVRQNGIKNKDEKFYEAGALETPAMRWRKSAHWEVQSASIRKLRGKRPNVTLLDLQKITRTRCGLAAADRAGRCIRWLHNQTRKRRAPKGPMTLKMN